MKCHESKAQLYILSSSLFELASHCSEAPKEGILAMGL